MDVKPKDAVPDLLRFCRPVAERSNLPMAVVEGTTPILRYVNPAFCSLIGRKSEELIGKPFAEMVPEGKACLALLSRIYRTGEAETYTKPEPGEVYPGSRSYAMWPVLGSDGGPLGVLIQVNETTLFQQHAAAMNQSLLLFGIRQHELTEAAEKQNAQLQLEIDERKRAEEALRRSETLLRTVMDNCADAIFMKDRDSRILMANPATCAVVGKPAEQIIGRTDEEVYSDPAAGRTIMENDRRIMESGKTEVIEEVAPGPNGPRVFLSTKTPYHDAEGRILGLVGVGRDITDRKQAEEAVRDALSVAEEERNVLKAMMEYIPMGITIADGPDVRIRAVSRFGRELTRKPRERLEGIPVEEHVEAFDIFRSDGVTPATNEELPLTRASQKGEVIKEEEWVIGRPDGTKIPVLCTAAPIRDSKGYITGGVVGWQDVTERKKMEEELCRSRDELEYRVETKTAELRTTNRALNEYAARLEKLNQELQEFAFVASHDLSEPLRKIQTFGSLLQEKASDRLGEAEKDYISRMALAANRMQELLDALLGYSRIETKGQEFKTLRLNDLVKDAAGDLEVAIRKIGAHIEIGPLPTIEGDPYQWRQVFQNLIGNATKYHRSEVKPYIKIHGEEKDGLCHIFVEDNGIGFEEKYLDKIFQPFQRLHGRNEYSGTGIGLSICKKVVERHGGKITARSTPGKGSTFIVTLPVNGTKAENKLG